MCKPSEIYWFLIILLSISCGGLTAKTKHRAASKPVDTSDIGKQVLIVKHVGNCDEKKNYTFYLPNFKVVQFRKNVYVMTGIIDIRDDFINRKMRATIDASKCDFTFESENCQPFIHWPVDDLCKFFNSDDSVYGIFLKNYADRPKCPLKKKSHQLNNVPVNLEIISILPNVGMQNYVIHVKFYADKSLVGCFAVHTSIRVKRS